MTTRNSDGPEVVAAEKSLADELRRIVNRLVLVRPGAEELLAAVKGASDFADLLDSLPNREGNVISEAGLSPQDHVRHSPWSGSSNPLAPPMTSWVVEGSVDGPEGRRTEGRITFGAAYEGPPGHVHGGCLAGAFDELLGRSQYRAGFTGRLTIDYRRPAPLGRSLDLCAWVERTEGRKRWVRGIARFGEEVLAEAEGLFIAPRGGNSTEAMTESLLRLSPDEQLGAVAWPNRGGG